MAFAETVDPAIPMPFANIPIFDPATDHIPILPELLVAAFEPMLPIRRIKLTNPIPHVEFTLRWHAVSLADPLHTGMVAQIGLAAQFQRAGHGSPSRCASRQSPTLQADGTRTMLQRGHYAGCIALRFKRASRSRDRRSNWQLP